MIRDLFPAVSLALTLGVACVAGTASAEAERVSTAFTLDTGHPRAPEQMAVRFDSAALAIRVAPEDKAIEADATLGFTALSPVARLVVELDTRFHIESVSVDGAPIPAGAWRNPEGRLSVDLPRPLAAGEPVRLDIAYAGRPHEARNAPWDGGFVWATAPDGQPWIATAVQGQGCDLFWPCIDHPEGEPGVMDLAITVPAGLSAPSNGRLLGVDRHPDGSSTWRWRARQPNPYGVALNIGPYVEMTGEHLSRFGNRIPLHFWRLASDDADKAVALFDQFGPMLDFYEAVVGPYPFADEKMGVVVTPHLGMEHQTINAYGNGYRLDGRGYDWLLHHELAHEWFGNQMTNADWDHMWLHEGFGTYVQPLYDRWLHGDRAMEAALQTMRLAVTNRFPIVSNASRTGQDVYDGARGPGLDLYYKGALIAHTLRLMIGDEAFGETLRRLVYGRPDPRPGNFQPRYAVTADYVAIVEQVTGRDLGWFFDAYLYHAALPDLVQTRDGERLMLEWVTGSDQPFAMPVDIEVGGRRVTAPMTGGRGEITVPAGAHVLVDPENKVLRRLPHIEAWQAAR